MAAVKAAKRKETFIVLMFGVMYLFGGISLLVCLVFVVVVMTPMVTPMVTTMVMTMTTQMMGTLPFPKQQYTPEQGASEAIVNSQK